MDLKLVKQLLDLISDSDANEISIEEGNFKLKVKKQSDTPAAHHVQYHVPAQTQPASNPIPSPAETAKPGQAEPVSKTEGDIIKSPIVGTFYESPSPDSDPFVKVGDHIEKGQPLCIIEAMKIMNEIESEFSGIIQKIMVSNGSPVEFDQPLFIIKKD
jgi:acetyl-CoA carboxylase biotin carboxyl carrier protein